MNVFTRHYLRRECLHEPPLSPMSSYIFGGHLRWVSWINRDFYLCFPMNLTNTLVPQPVLSSILQDQLGVALDALTISPFLVIDDKLVEVFNEDKSMWNCKGLRYCLHRWQKGSSWRCAYKCFALECKCTWQVVLVEILFTIWRQYIMHEQI